MPKIGPTGEFPFGKPVDETDRGGLHVQVLVFPRDGQMFLNFGTITEYVNATPAEARQMAMILRDGVHRTWGKLSYNKHELPIRVEIIHREVGQLVQITFPHRGAGLIANPEVFLSLADVIEDRLREAGITVF